MAAWAAAVKERDGWRCRKCGKAGRLEADHVTPLDRGGAPFDLANGQALCVRCHVIKTRAENRRGGPDPDREKWRAYIRAK